MSPQISNYYVTHRNIIIFLGEHPEQFKNDILHSSLMAELIADSTPVNWRSIYRNALSKFFWIMGNTKVSSYKKHPCSLLDISKEALSSNLQKNQLRQLSEAFSTIAQLPEDAPAYEAVLNGLQNEHPPTGDENAAFTTNTLLTIVCENKEILALKISLESTEAPGFTFLTQPIPEKIIAGEIKASLWTANLIERNYAKIRDQIISKLGSKPQTHLWSISA